MGDIIVLVVLGLSVTLAVAKLRKEKEKAAAVAVAAAVPGAVTPDSNHWKEALSLRTGHSPVRNDSFFISALAIAASFDYNKLNYYL